MAIDGLPPSDGVGDTSAPGDDAPATLADTLVAGPVGERCVRCSAPLASDQRYCVVCGERRGAPRFVLPRGESAPGSPPPETPPGPARRARPRFGQGPTLIAGVATLLLAMLVGVLIGHGIGGQGSTKTVASAPVRIITTGNGTSAPAASTPANGGTSSSGSGASPRSRRGHRHAGTTKAKAAPVKKATPAAVKKQAVKETSAASKVLGGHDTPPATVTVGQTGTGKGYNKKTHKFDGSFFGQ